MDGSLPAMFAPFADVKMLGRVDANAILMNSSEKISISDLTKAWRGTLDW